MLTASLRWAGQPRASRSACSMMLMVSGPIRPVRSAASMNWWASSKPRVGRAPAGERLEPDQLARRKVDQRLEEGHELAVLDSAADVLLELQPVGQLALRARIEPGEAVAAGALRGIERNVALAQHDLLAWRRARRRQGRSMRKPGPGLRRRTAAWRCGRGSCGRYLRQQRRWRSERQARTRRRRCARSRRPRARPFRAASRQCAAVRHRPDAREGR